MAVRGLGATPPTRGAGAAQKLRARDELAWIERESAGSNRREETLADGLGEGVQGPEAAPPERDEKSSSRCK